MIASIEGTIRSKDGNRVVIAVGGVGLEVFVPERTLAAIGGEGEPVGLHTYLHVREDILTLYGFRDENERSLFMALLGVSGVGPKVALAILSASGAGDIATLIYNKDTGALTSFPGIGKKTAERIVLELKDKIERYVTEDKATCAGFDRQLFEEAVAALMTIGLTRAGAQEAIGKIDTVSLSAPCRVEDVVREALKQTSSSV